MMSSYQSIVFRMSLVTCIVFLHSCNGKIPNNKINQQESLKTIGQVEDHDIYGTKTPFAKNSVYFLLTDRFVNGDKSNDHRNQGGRNHTFNRPLNGPHENDANVGYLGGDFKGILKNASYFREMGFTAIWLSPIVDNPDESFTGGQPIHFGGAFKDGGKTGYHGYWGDNFFKVDEHWPSVDLSFHELTTTLSKKYGLKTVLDVVLNHGSPAFSMKPVEQPKFGKIYDQNWKLIADHQNLPAEQLDSKNPLHQFYNHKTEITQLSDMNENNPKVLDYFVHAYLHWIDEGADAFRIDTLKHMPHTFWKKFTDRIRERHPEFFMFGEDYNYDAKKIGEDTFPENGQINVLDFPGQKAISKVFENPNSDFNRLLSYLHLNDGTYYNPYDLMTFYDNHDMKRMKTDSNGFIDANNWLFTSRGIPVIYYGSEIGFMSGTKEHTGNRNYFGQKNIDQARNNIIYKKLKTIANIRKNNISLQRGVQVNLNFKKNIAVFYRIYEDKNIQQTALVILNKGNKIKKIKIRKYLSDGCWINAKDKTITKIKKSEILNVTVGAHDSSIFILNKKNSNLPFREMARSLMSKSPD